MDSFDSSEEYSLYHWIEVRKLVDEADMPFFDEGLEYAREIEKALGEAVSEVEPATTYQHFARNVV